MSWCPAKAPTKSKKESHDAPSDRRAINLRMSASREDKSLIKATNDETQDNTSQTKKIKNHQKKLPSFSSAPPKVVAYLSKEGITEPVDENGDNPIHVLARKIIDKDFNLWRLMTLGVDVNMLNNDGDTPLHYCLYYDNMRLFSWLLELDSVDINKKNSFGISPILWIKMNAALPRILERIGEKSAQRLQTAYEAYSHALTIYSDRDIVLLNAVKNGVAPIFKQCVTILGCAVNAKHTIDGKEARLFEHVMSSCGDIGAALEMALVLASAKDLFKHGVGSAPFTLVTLQPRGEKQRYNFIRVFETLMRKDFVTISVFDDITHETLLHCASFYSSVFVVKYLLRKGADITCLTKAGETALHYAARRKSTKVLKALLNHVKERRLEYLLEEQGSNGSLIDIAGKHSQKSCKIIEKYSTPTESTQFSSLLPIEVWSHVFGFVTSHTSFLAMAWTCRTFGAMIGHIVRDEHCTGMHNFKPTWLSLPQRNIRVMESRASRKISLSSLKRSIKLQANVVCDDFIKIVLVGDLGVGRHPLMQRFSAGKPDVLYTLANQHTTLVKTVHFESKAIKLQLIRPHEDPSGYVSNSAYRQVDCFIVCCAMNSAKSFKSVAKWHRDVSRYGNEGAPTILALLNADRIEDRQVHMGEVRAYCKSAGICGIEVSAKTNYNVQKLFDVVIELYLANNKKQAKK